MIILKDTYFEIFIPEEFSNLEVIYKNDWSGYEEWGCIVIFKFYDELYKLEYEYCVMSEDNTMYFDPQAITEDEYKELVAHWEPICGLVDGDL